MVLLSLNLLWIRAGPGWFPYRRCDSSAIAERAKMAELLKYATIIISSLPLLVMYPFFQKYFDAGIMAGSFKG